MVRALDARRQAVRWVALASVAAIAAGILVFRDPQHLEILVDLLVFPLFLGAFALDRRRYLVLVPLFAVVINLTAYARGMPITLALVSAGGIIVAGAMLSALLEANRRLTATEHQLEIRQSELAQSFDMTTTQLRRQRALVACSRALLAPGGHGDLDDALRRLAEALSADGAVMFRNEEDPEQGLVRRAIAWAPIGRFSEVAVPEVTPWSRFPNQMARLSAGRTFSFSDRDSVPFPDRASYMQRPEPVEAAIAIPVLIDDRWVGHVAAFMLSHGRQWTIEDSALLSTVAEMIAASWARDESVTRLQEALGQRDLSLKLQGALTECSRTLLQPGDENLTEALTVIRDAIGADLAYVLEVFDDPGAGPSYRPLHVVGGAEVPASALGPGAWASRPDTYQTLVGGRPHMFDHIDQVSDKERGLYLRSSSPIVSELDFPVSVADQMTAVVGVAGYRPRVWTPGEIRTMATVSRMLSAFWRRNLDTVALEDLVRSKDRFIASVSHELRTPMAVVMGLSSELNTRRREFSDPEVDEFIDLISRQSLEVTHIIEDLLVAARAQETGLTVRGERTRLDDEVRTVLTDLPSDYTFKLEAVALEEVAVLADPLRVRQIVRNLITNSHRHGGDTVSVTLETVADNARLIVADNGTGVPEDQQDAIFEAYASLVPRQGRTASIGLGLTVSRQLARLMGGDVVYQDTPTPRFVLSLPLIAPLDETAESAEEARVTSRRSPRS